MGIGWGPEMAGQFLPCQPGRAVTQAMVAAPSVTPCSGATQPFGSHACGALKLAPVGRHNRPPNGRQICCSELSWWAAASGRPPGGSRSRGGRRVVGEWRRPLLRSMCAWREEQQGMQRGAGWLPQVAVVALPGATGGDGDDTFARESSSGTAVGLEEDSDDPGAEEVLPISKGSKRKWGEPRWVTWLLGLQEGAVVWKVPWSQGKVLQVMVFWFLAFWLVGSYAIPAAVHVFGIDRSALGHRGQALYSLVTDIAELGVSIGILAGALWRYREQLERPPWFVWQWQRPRWLLQPLLATATFPLVHTLSHLNMSLCPGPASPSTMPLEQSLSAKDPIATLLYALVVSLCAPIWEELIFRGFLLPSLTQRHPLWLAILLSALAFACAHFSLQRILPLCFLGVVMGVVYVRTKNLAASMLLHALWNLFVFVTLLN